MYPEYLSFDHKIASSSITFKIQEGGVTPDSQAFMWIEDDMSAIFNNSIPYETFYIEGQLTDTRFIERGTPTSGTIYTGEEYTYLELWQVLGLEYVHFNIEEIVRGVCVLDEDQDPCTISSVYECNGTEGKYLWEVSGAVGEPDNTKRTFEVTTTGINDVSFKVTLTVTSGDTKTATQTFKHTRIYIPAYVIAYFDSTLITYDSTNYTMDGDD